MSQINHMFEFCAYTASVATLQAPRAGSPSPIQMIDAIIGREKLTESASVPSFQDDRGNQQHEAGAA